MFLNSLYKKVLLDPAYQGDTELYAVSGYASATFANRHLNEASSFALRLIVGMPSKISDHAGWLSLLDRNPQRLSVHYLDSSPYVHCKAYGWFRNDQPSLAFTGSANYTQPGFIDHSQWNQMVADDANKVLGLYRDLIPRSVDIRDFQPKQEAPTKTRSNLTISGCALPGDIEWLTQNQSVRISFLQKNGTVPGRSGLNWGQRPEYGRDPNQAYLSIKKDARNEGFLPPQARTFTLVTDDGLAFDCVVAQQGRKAIQSTNDNSELGSYIRKRLRLQSGEPVTREHLKRYGRDDYTITKLDEETFLLDFSI